MEERQVPATTMIWGAGGGIGRALVHALHTAGSTVAAVVRRPHNLPAAGARRPHDLPESEARRPHDLPAAVAYEPYDLPVALELEADVADEFSVQRAVFAAAQQLPAVDLWIYAAGDIAAAPVAGMDDTTWRRILDANLTGAYRAVHHSLPLLAEDAHIVFLGAYSERLQLPGLSAYAAAKAGLEAFAVALAKEERRRRVTLVRPGAVATPLWEKMPVRLPRSASTPEEIAGKILQAVREGHRGQLDL
jgi:NAD(P)-dependent dehydrogenase (short-subunit alcohol dehydrogenase family)